MQDVTVNPTPEPIQAKTERLVVGDLVVNLSQSRISKDSTEIHFTKREYKFFHMLALYAFTRCFVQADPLLREMHGRQINEYDMGAMRVHLSRIRKKLNKAGSVVDIVNNRQAGYYFADAKGALVEISA